MQAPVLREGHGGLVIFCVMLGANTMRIGRGTLSLITALIAFGAYVGSLRSSHAVEGLQLRAHDFFTAIRYQRSPHPPALRDFVLVLIDDESYKRMGLRWPWDRTVLASAIDRLHAAGARFICLDLVLSGQTTLASDQRLADALQRAGNVLIASYFGSSEEFVTPHPLIAQSARAVGTVNILRDLDFRVRRAHIVHPSRTLQGQEYALSIELAAAMLGAIPQTQGDVLSLTDPGGQLLQEVPLRADGTMPINYMALLSDVPSIPIHRILQSDEPIELLRDKVVLVGFSGYIFHDDHATPLGTQPGLILILNSVLTVLTGHVETTVPLRLQWLLMFFAGLTASVVTFRYSPLVACVVSGTLVALFIWSSALLSFQHRTWDLIGVPLIVGIIFFGGTLYRTIVLAIESARLLLQATTDGLTGVANLRYLQARLEHELTRVMRYHTPLSIVMFDIDHFKLINDRHGHGGGNEVLKGVVDILRRQVRSADFIARFGGDEFCVLLCNTTGEGAVTFAEHLRAMVSQRAFSSATGPVRVTLSMGITEVNGTQERARLGWEEALEQADVALYQSKRAGRNRLTRFTQEKKDTT